MVKVFLVEDEIVIREGIKNNIPWNEYDLQFCGEASDGELAFPMIQEQCPDILITDIKMPFMDGLELSRLVKKELPKTKIIILSGYGEFAYAREGIEIGIENYLLKPITSEDLLKEVNVVAEKIREELKEQEIQRKIAADMIENVLSEKKVIFQDMVNGHSSPMELMERGKKLGMNLSAGCYNICLFRVKSLKQGDSEFSQVAVRIRQDIEKEIKNNENLIIFDRNPDGIAILIKGSDEVLVKKQQQEMVEATKNRVDKEPSVSYFGGFGKPVHRLSELPTSFEEAQRAFAYRFLMDENQVLDSDKLEACNLSLSHDRNEITDVMVGQVNTEKLDSKRIEKFLKGGEKEEIRFFAEEFFKSMGEAGENSVIFRQYIAMDVFFAVNRFLDSLDMREKQIKNPFKDSEEMKKVMSSLEATVEYVEKLMEKAMSIRDEMSTKRYGDAVSQTCKYIEEHYMEEELSLNTVAASVNVSPNHLSTLFSQKTGQTFIKYLTDLRIDKAKELLKCTSMKSSEIGFQIGYSDPHYFSSIFKKSTGVTPTQYRGD